MIAKNEHPSTGQKSSPPEISPYPYCDPQGNLVPEVHFERALETFGEILQETGRIYIKGDDLWYQEGFTILPLTRSGKVTSKATSLISRHIIGLERKKGKDGDTFFHFQLHKKFLHLAFNHPSTRSMLQAIKEVHYSPFLDRQGELIEEGFSSDLGVLILDPTRTSEEEEPRTWDPKKSFPQNLPFTMGLLEEFLFRTAQDKLRFLGFLLALPMHRWLKDQPRPILELRGNQPNLGKTLLGKVFGILAEGTEPVSLDGMTPQALAREHQRLVELSSSKVRLLDNLRGKIDNTWLERIVTSPTHQHFSAELGDFVRTRNDFFWILTANDLELTPDLEDRVLRVELYYSGSPMDLTFQRDPFGFARKHRGKILRELSSLCQANLAPNLDLVQRKTTLAPEPTSHRCRLWANLVRQIFEGVGIPCPSLAAKEYPHRPASPEILFQNLIQSLLVKHPELFQDPSSKEKVSQTSPEETSSKEISRSIHPHGLQTWELADALEDSDLQFYSLEQRETPTNLSSAMGRLLAKFQGIAFVVCPPDCEPLKVRLQVRRGGKNIARYRFLVESCPSRLPDWKPGSPHPAFPTFSGNPDENHPIRVIRHEDWIRQERIALAPLESSGLEENVNLVGQTSLKTLPIRLVPLEEEPKSGNDEFENFLTELGWIHNEQEIAREKERNKISKDPLYDDDFSDDLASPEGESATAPEGSPSGGGTGANPDHEAAIRQAALDEARKHEEELLGAIAQSDQAAPRWGPKPPDSLWANFYQEDPTKEKLHAILGEFYKFTDWIFDVYICSTFLPRHMYGRFLKLNDFAKQKFIVENTVFKHGKNLFVGFRFNVINKLYDYHEFKHRIEDIDYQTELLSDFYPRRPMVEAKFIPPKWVDHSFQNEPLHIKKILLHRWEENESTLRRYLKWAKNTKGPVIKGIKIIGAKPNEIEGIKKLLNLR